MNNERFILYTWQDIENYLFSIHNLWPSGWNKIDVFSNEIVIYTNAIDENFKKTSRVFFREHLKGYYLDDKIQIPITHTELYIFYEISDIEHKKRKPFPLFRDFSYVNETNDADIQALQGVPVIAFHSYKGGVGRTLSLIAFVRSMLARYGTEKKVLIVDGDMEAPGLTWLGQEQYGDYEFSYVDMLNIISAKGIDDEIYENLSHIVENSYLRFHDEKLTVDQYFIPTYRDVNQLLDIYSKPERIMAGDKNKYITINEQI